jgi:hypothetical protein
MNIFYYINFYYENFHLVFHELLSFHITSAREKDILEFKHEIDMINLILDAQTN